MTSSGTGRISGGAVLGFVLGLSALVLLVTGLPAVLVGWLSLRAIHSSEGRLRGRLLAVAAMVLGLAGTVFLVLGSIAVAVNHFRGQSQKAECAFNLGRIGLAVNKYLDFRGHYPPGTVPAPALPPQKRLSWLAGILPVLEREAGADRGQKFPGPLDLPLAWDAGPNAKAAGATVRLFVCPSNPSYQPGTRPGPTSYVGLAGLDPDAATLPKEDRRAGFFGYDRLIDADDLEAGTSNTLAAAETARDNGPWAAGGFPTVRGLEPEATRYLGPGAPLGGCHPGGALVLMSDASFRFLATSISPAVIRDLSLLHRPPAP